MRIVWVMLMAAIAGLAADRTVYIGTRTRGGQSEGIYRARFNPATGALTDVSLAAVTADPSFLAIHSTRPLLFAVSAVPEGKVKAFQRGPDGSLVLLIEVSSKGAGPAHVQVDRSGNWLAAANYTSGSAAVFRIETDGRLSEAVDWVQHEGKGAHPVRQSGPHAHSVNFSADNHFLYVADLGLDQVKTYAFDAKTGKLKAVAPLQTAPGDGPRHLALGKQRVYVLNELTSTVSVFDRGTLLESVSALPTGFHGETTAAEIVLDASERYLYASNRGADTIAVFRVGDHLTKIADTKGAKVPRGFVLSPDGRFLLAGSQDENLVQVYKIDATTGLLSATGGSVNVPTPICLRFAPQ